MKNILLLAICLITILSCQSSSKEEIDEYRITEMYERIETAFEVDDIYTIMQQYHDDFYHEFEDLSSIEYYWTNMVFNHDEIKFSNIEITYQTKRQVKISATVTIDGAEYNLQEDIDHLQFLYKDNDVWKIIGNQLY